MRHPWHFPHKHKIITAASIIITVFKAERGKRRYSLIHVFLISKFTRFSRIPGTLSLRSHWQELYPILPLAAGSLKKHVLSLEASAEGERSEEWYLFFVFTYR
jgi:hypothetical protein